ncbi:MAG: DUF2752 domain-containing protein [Planctomycetota bacterium]|nr:DUF2752 domain-containing protein [Planctomycetota bacterium]
MSTVVPTIYSPRTPAVRLNAGHRVLALVISLTCIGLLTTAAGLTPSPGGMGTHTALGLAPCAFAERTGLPCPSCGMTTSFAWFARGNLIASFYIQPMGMLLAVLATAAFWIGFYEALTGRAMHRLLLFIPVRYYIVPLLSIAIIAWAWKIFIHTHGIDGWHT